MLSKILKKIISSKNEQELSRILPLVNKINEIEAKMTSLSNVDLQALTINFRERLFLGASLDGLLPEAFAVVREAAKRTIGQRHFDVQLIGGIVLHEGKIAEMKTGEGKTLTATLPVYLNALSSHGVHVVTVNDYLASRDAAWMGSIYRFLGLTVGCILHSLSDSERYTSYAADVTYGTNNEFGFDYLRDNMKFNLEHIAQRGFHYAIVDEVDSILIDEARTPLIISGAAEKSTHLYTEVDRIIPQLKKDRDFNVDEKTRTAIFTDEGVSRCEELLAIENLYDPRTIDILHHLQQALKAYTLFKRDVEYIVKNGEVIIVDEFTGRLMPGRRYSDGLHQALEAKEKLRVANENQTLATITFQNYFRLYQKLSGMTGTAITEAEEFYKIYKLKVVSIPTHRPMIRIDNPDVVYRTQMEKVEAAIQKIKQLHYKGQPVLVGTINIEKSELFSNKLKKLSIPHTVLNAKQHAREAEFVAQAGRLGAVTISTNMAGRGTDIILGGNPSFLARQKVDPEKDFEAYAVALQKYEAICTQEREQVCKLGGLHILGTERHESRRIDNQLRGRSGRQGDPGSSCFYLSLEDDLLRLFGSDRISGLMQKLGMKEGDPIESNIITKAIENAQRKIESRNFEIRKNLLEYDDVLNKQREVIYTQRHLALSGESIRDMVLEMISDIAKEIVIAFNNQENKLSNEEYCAALGKIVMSVLKVKLDCHEQQVWNIEELSLTIEKLAKVKYQNKINSYSQDSICYIERMVFLQILDSLWKDHLLNMDYLKEGIGLRGYGQKDPLREYQREGYEMFMDMINRVKTEAVTTLMRLEINSLEEKKNLIAEQKTFPLSFVIGNESISEIKNNRKVKVGRNAPCPCGSGRKYKKCCR